ncbi:M3 family oligoendopeptidase [Candidatus Saccharibacteria bacterium]|nr:M3 family oligoendopeptidase [Candidatus Saccharibacteria bacterium]
MTKYIHYPNRPKKLTAAFVKKEYDKLLAALPNAENSNSPDAWLALYADWNALKSYVSSEGARIYWRFSQNMNNKSAEATEKYLREKIAPVCDKPEFSLTKAFLASRHRAALAKRYGEQLVQDYETALKPLDPVNTQLGIKAGQLTKRYEKKVAGATVHVQGEKITLSKARSLLESDDGKLRQAAYLAGRNWFLKNHDQLADIYDQLVKLRHKMAKNVGYSSYTSLAYKNMGRTDYDPKLAKTFRDNVYKYIVPLYATLTKAQSKALGTKTLKPWDASYDPSTSLPLGVAPVDKQLDNAQRIFTRLSSILGEHFRQMRRDGLVDLENRLHKRTGAFCISFSDEDKAAVLCNSVGDAEDIRILTHEMGHAFQSLESQTIETVDLQSGTADLAEVYSMGMEFLSLEYIDEFFSSEDAKKFRVSRWSGAIKIICYVCVVDEYQHWVYDNVNASAGERDKKWCELSDKYTPGVDYKGFEKYKKSRWYAQSHIFSAPFYYIDYALAETGAMQLGMLADESHVKAVSKYLKLCKIGGTKSFLKALDSAGLRSPFEEKLIVKLAQHAQKILL